MPTSRRRAIAALLTLVLALLPAAAAADPGPSRGATGRSVPLDALVMAIAGWVAADRGTAVPVLPRIVLLPRERMIKTFDAARRLPANGGAQDPTSDLLAFYNTRTRTIYLPGGWRGDSPGELSILVHEMVHHFQTVERERFPCGAARERDAYAAQARWLERHGQTLASALAIDPLFVLLATNCLF